MCPHPAGNEQNLRRQYYYSPVAFQSSHGLLRPRLHGSGRNFYTDKNLHGSTSRSHGTGGTGRSFERLSVQVWDLKKAGQLFDRHGSTMHTDSWKHPNRARFARLARLRHGIYLRFFLSKNVVDTKQINKSTIQTWGDKRQLHASVFEPDSMGYCSTRCYKWPSSPMFIDRGNVHIWLNFFVSMYSSQNNWSWKKSQTRKQRLICRVPHLTTTWLAKNISLTNHSRDF